MTCSTGRAGPCLLGGLLLLTAGANPAHAVAPADPIGLPAIQLDGAQLANRPAFAFGWEFSLSQAAAIQALGVYDHDDDGLAGLFEAGLYDSVGRLLAQTVIEGQGDGVAGGFTWRTIPRLELPAGTYVVAAAGIWAGGDRVPYNAEQALTAAGVSYLRPRFQPGVTSLGAPLDAFPAGISVQGYWGASFALAADPGLGPGPGRSLPPGDDNDKSDDDSERDTSEANDSDEDEDEDENDEDEDDISDDVAQAGADAPSGDSMPRSTPGPLGLLGLLEALRRSRMLRRRSAHRHLQAGGLQHHRGAGAQAPALQAEIGGLGGGLGQQGLQLDREAGR